MTTQLKEKLLTLQVGEAAKIPFNELAEANRPKLKSKLRMKGGEWDVTPGKDALQIVRTK